MVRRLLSSGQLSKINEMLNAFLTLRGKIHSSNIKIRTQMPE